VAQRDPLSMVVLWEGFDVTALPEIRKRVRRWLCADWEPAPAMAALPQDAALIALGGGRLLRCSSFYEDFVKTVLTINTSWWSTCRMAAALVVEPGAGAFPGPEISATRRLREDGAIDAAGDGQPEHLDHDYLVSLKGIGPYAAAHCRLLLHDFSRIPVDSAVVAYLRERQGCSPAEFAASWSSWGPYLALGYRLTRLREKLAQAAEPVIPIEPGPPPFQALRRTKRRGMPA